jgi:hypothetical protein
MHKNTFKIEEKKTNKIIEIHFVQDHIQLQREVHPTKRRSTRAKRNQNSKNSST